jgi:DNA-binding protein YbaB
MANEKNKPLDQAQVLTQNIQELQSNLNKQHFSGSASLQEKTPCKDAIFTLDGLGRPTQPIQLSPQAHQAPKAQLERLITQALNNALAMIDQANTQALRTIAQNLQQEQSQDQKTS